MLNILQNSVLAKVLGLVLLTALLCIPLARIGALIEERGQSHISSLSSSAAKQVMQSLPTREGRPPAAPWTLST